MKIHGLDLDNSPLISQDKALRYARNITIGEGNQSYINEDGFEAKFNIEEEILEYLDFPKDDHYSFDIIGTIPTNIGVVLFCVLYNDYIDSSETPNILRSQHCHCIVYITTNEIFKINKIIYTLDFVNEIMIDDYEYHKLESLTGFKFNIQNPIHGDYIYNYKNELIITFTEGLNSTNETRTINITNPYGGNYSYPDGDEDTSELRYLVTDISSLNLIPDVEYPTMNIIVEEGGNLKTGAYQIAISYKLQDGTYTNYSILSVPVIVCGNYGEDYAPNSEINRKIIVSFDKPNVSYDIYKLGIVHCNGISQDCYETEDITLENELNNYTISNLNNYNTIILDDIFIKNISYIREKTLINYNNRLIRGNVQTLNYKDLNESLEYFTNNNFNVEITFNNPNSYINTSKAYFKVGECYVLFVGYFDYKGDLINIYKIPVKNNNYKLNEEDQYVHYINPILTQTNEIDIGKVPKSFFDGTIGYDFNMISNKIYNDGYYTYGVKALNNQTALYNINSEQCIIKTIFGDISDSVIKLTNNKDYTIKYNIKLDPVIQFTEETSAKINVALYSLTPHYSIDEETYYTLNELLYQDETDFTRNTKFRLNDIFNYQLELEANSTIKFAIIITFKSDIENILSLIPVKLSEYGIPGSTAIINIRNNTLNNPYVKSVAYFYIEHNTYNSRILSQALCVPDTNVVNFTADQKYEGQFQGKYALRFYPFEYLYNKIAKISAIINWKYNIGKPIGDTNISDGSISFPNLFENETLESTYAVRDTNEENDDFTNTWAKHGIKIIDCDINSIINLDKNDSKKISLEYISNDNTSQQNIAGDSYYRTKDLTIEDYHNDLDDSDEDSIYNIDYYIADLINPANNLYSNLDNQKLQIASPIIPITSIENVTLIGDTYLSYLTLRLTTPHKSFVYGNSEFKEGDSNLTVWRWIFTFPIESKYNITARYSDNIIDKPYFLHNAILQKYVELLGTSYKVDNYINTNVGKGYNPVYNENGIEQFSYYKEIPGTSNHPYRIIRSLAQNPESIALNWRTFKTDDYKDMPFNRGEIISLKTDNKNLYIQQKYGLHLLQQRDQLNNDDANNSYLGTSDLFNMEPKEIVYSPSGYIGCESYFDTDVNIAGYVVIDAVHKKIFLINGDKPLEISNIKTREYFEKFIDASLINPYNKQGRIINYNEDRNILYITQINGNDANSKTMSFSPLIKSWVSFHTYIPDLGFVNRNGLFWGKNGILYQPNSTIKGKYWDNTAEPSVIQFILNENTIYNKLLKTIVWKDQVSYKGDDYIQHFFKETINHIMVHNFNQCSGKLDVGFNDTKQWWNGDTGVNKINLWRFNKLFDLVTNPQEQFMINPTTPNDTKLKWDISTAKPLYKWYDVNRFICQFIYLTMWCDNKPINDKYHEWELIDVHPEWQLDNRNDQTYTTKENNQ